MADRSEAARKACETRRRRAAFAKASSSARGSWQTRRRIAASAKARATEAASKEIVREVLEKEGYRIVYFEGSTGAPRTGIVDGLAFRITPGDADRIEIILLQLKAGSAGATGREVKRLNEALLKASVGWKVAAVDGDNVYFLTGDQ